MSKSTKILVIPSWYPPDGGYFFKEHSESLSETGWEVDVLATRMIGMRKIIKEGPGIVKGFKKNSENGLTVYRSVFLKIPGNERTNINRRTNHILNKFEKYAFKEGLPDLIIAHSVTWAGYAAYLIHREFNIPYCIIEHRSYFVWRSEEARKLIKPYYLPYFEKAYRNCAKLVLVSESQLTGLKTLFNWIEEKIQVIPNMIRENMFLPPDVTRSTDPFIFIWAGRLEWVKGVDILLKAVRELKTKTEHRFSVRLAGRGSLSGDLMEMTREFEIEDVVHFLGRLSRTALQEEMQSANCFILPTRYEAFGVVLIEAMASGLPVIATRSGGPENIVTEESGLLIDTEDSCQLADAMLNMIMNHPSYNPEEIRSNVIQTYGHRIIMERYNQLIRELIQK
jgi:glycosyltransferase involved in cell wall biosynthesis